MGYPKPLLRIGDTTFLDRTAHTMLAAVGRLVVVLGAHRERVARAIPDDPRIAAVTNPHYERGQLSSLQVALAAVAPSSDAVVVHLADHPLVRMETFRDLISRYESGGKPIVIARYQGRRGHPVLFDRSLFGELLAAPHEQGARVVVNADPARVDYLEVADPGVTLDLDTPADLAAAGLAAPPANVSCG